MTYNEAENLIDVYSNIIGKPLLNKMAILDGRKITSLLISPRHRLRKFLLYGGIMEMITKKQF